MRTLFSIGVLLLFAGCASFNKSLPPENYLTWYSSPDFAWKGTDTVQDVACAIRLLPNEVRIATCAMDQCETRETLREKLSTKQETVDFIVEFTSLEASTAFFDQAGTIRSDREQRIGYFSNGIKKDICGLTRSGDTIACQAVIYEPTLPQKARLLITLDTSKKGICELIVAERMITGGTFRFAIPELTTKSIPTLKL